MGVGGLPGSPPLVLLRADLDSGLSGQEPHLSAGGRSGGRGPGAGKLDDGQAQGLGAWPRGPDPGEQSGSSSKTNFKDGE